MAGAHKPEVAGRSLEYAKSKLMVPDTIVRVASGDNLWQ
jgi:hypothetical protein